jgi:hypothetical protein
VVPPLTLPQRRFNGEQLRRAVAENRSVPRATPSWLAHAMMPRMSNTEIIAERDTKSGRFLTGNKRSVGRPKGARDRHSRTMLNAFADDFELHGAAVIERVRLEKPDVYLRVACDLLPKNIELDVDVVMMHDVSNVVEAFRIASATLGVDPQRGLRRLQKLDRDGFLDVDQ